MDLSHKTDQVKTSLLFVLLFALKETWAFNIPHRDDLCQKQKDHQAEAGKCYLKGLLMDMDHQDQKRINLYLKAQPFFNPHLFKSLWVWL